jgi:excisionase family DNA binding protein
MKPTRLQFGARENTASSRQHAPRLERPSLPSGGSLSDRPLAAATGGEGGCNADATPSVIPTNKLMHAFEPLVGCGEAAKLLGNIHVKTLQRYARRGDIPGYQIGGHWYFRTSELDSWLRSQINSSCHPCRSNEEAK